MDAHNAHHTPTAADVPDSAYHVRTQSGWTRKGLTAIFTPLDDMFAPTVGIRARFHPDNENQDYDLLTDWPLFWQRDASNILTLHAPDAPYGRTPASKPGPYLVRVENNDYLTLPVAEANVLKIGELLRTQIEAASELS